MARINTKASALYFLSGSTLPVPTAGFIDSTEKIVWTPTVKTDKFMVINGKLGQWDSYADVDDTVIEGETISHRVRFQNSAADALGTQPAYGEMLKSSGFGEVIDTTTPGEETVTYTWDNTTSQINGSAVYYMNGKKQTFTGTMAVSSAFNITVGEPVTFDFTVSGFFDNKGIAIDEANPTPPSLTEPVVVAQKVDVMTKGGTAIVGANNISLDMASTINKRYGLGLGEYEGTDFEPTFSVEFPPDLTEYNQGILDLQAQSLYDIVIKLGTNNGTEVNGKTIVMTITNVKLFNSSDADNEDNIIRTNDFIFTSNTAFTIKTGFFS